MTEIHIKMCLCKYEGGQHWTRRKYIENGRILSDSSDKLKWVKCRLETAKPLKFFEKMFAPNQYKFYATKKSKLALANFHGIKINVNHSVNSIGKI